MKAKKSLSQFFLQDPSVIERIVSFLSFKKASLFLEIGPGTGALTKEVYKGPFSQFWVVEKDEALCKSLQKKYPLLSIFSGDILHFDFSFLPKTSTQLLGNLPYHLSQEILYYVLGNSAYFTQALFVLQKELVEKLIKRKTLLGAFLSFCADVQPLFVISKNAFSPRPKVDSLAFKLSFFSHLPIEKNSFFLFLQKLYQSKRKLLSSSLKNHFPKEFSSLSKQNPLLQKRVEHCSTEELTSLFLTFFKKDG